MKRLPRDVENRVLIVEADATPDTDTVLQGVCDDDIKIMTEEDAFFTTVLDPQRHPYQ